MKVYPEEYKWGEICKDSTPFCLIYSVSFSELPRILFIINVRPVYNKLFHYLT
ncbi:unknown [Bacteroides sp. CAG:754]|nr:unknown [Bacteroides sp. CAG:754]